MKWPFRQLQGVMQGNSSSGESSPSASPQQFENQSDAIMTDLYHTSSNNNYYDNNCNYSPKVDMLPHFATVDALVHQQAQHDLVLESPEARNSNESPSAFVLPPLRLVLGEFMK